VTRRHGGGHAGVGAGHLLRGEQAADLGDVLEAALAGAAVEAELHRQVRCPQQAELLGLRGTGRI
jgi:hypothetical protein